MISYRVQEVKLSSESGFYKMNLMYFTLNVHDEHLPKHFVIGANVAKNSDDPIVSCSIINNDEGLQAFNTNIMMTADRYRMLSTCGAHFPEAVSPELNFYSNHIGTPNDLSVSIDGMIKATLDIHQYLARQLDKLNDEKETDSARPFRDKTEDKNNLLSIMDRVTQANRQFKLSKMISTNEEQAVKTKEIDRNTAYGEQWGGW